MLEDLGFEGVAVLGVLAIVAVVGGYVAIRTSAAKKRGEDVERARWTALGEALPVAGAGLAGLFAFLTSIALIVMVIFVSFLNGSIFDDGDGVDSLIWTIFYGGVALLFGLPLVALAVVIWIRRSRRG